MIEPRSSIPIVFNNCISVKDAAYHSGYNVNYIRRMLRRGQLAGLKVGQVWLIDKSAFEDYLEEAAHATDQRFGPQ